MDARSRTDLELRQAQKLDDLGRVIAGTVHEINTLTQVVSDSLHFVQGARDEQEADIPDLADHLSTVVERALEALTRVTTIVRSLQTFAQPDQKDMTATDLNRAIRSTLTVARNEYKYVADVALDLGELQRVTCFAGEISQAVLNVVVNAAHAIGETVKETQQKGLITVSTRPEDDDVVIAITDTGANRAHDVDTTQRLAIARTIIVDGHGGTLTSEATPGVGATVILRFPIDGPRPASASS
jgi:signal transduction histidine kinase